MKEFQKIADLVDPDDKSGRTYRQINNSIEHKLNIGQKVKRIEDGIVLFVTSKMRDCDGTPLYSIGVGVPLIYGMGENALIAVEKEK